MVFRDLYKMSMHPGWERHRKTQNPLYYRFMRSHSGEPQGSRLSQAYGEPRESGALGTRDFTGIQHGIYRQVV